MPEHRVRWMFHSRAMVRDYDQAVERLSSLFGLQVLEYGESMQPEIGRRGGMAWMGDNSIEIGQPIVADGGAARFVARTGGGMHSIALQVTDLEGTIAHLEALGVRIAARPTPEMCFSDPRDTGGVFFQWSTFELDIDPHFGAEPADVRHSSLLDVTHHAFVGAVVDDPRRWADFYARILGTAVTFEDSDPHQGAPRAGISLRDCTLALFDLPDPDSTHPWGVAYPRSQVHVLALRVPDLVASECRLRDKQIRIERVNDNLMLLDTASTGGVQVALTQELLPGDART